MPRRLMYAGTAVSGAARALRCPADFCGAGHVLSGPGSPYDPERGPGYIRVTTRNLEEIGLSKKEKDAISGGNIIRLTGLTARG